MSTTSQSIADAELAQQPPDMLVFTDAAAGKVGELIREEANPKLKLRVFVSAEAVRAFNTASPSTRRSRKATSVWKTKVFSC